jgi:hypothetical protein
MAKWSLLIPFLHQSELAINIGEGGTGADQFEIALDIVDCLPELSAHGIHGFERVVLEDFFANFISEIFLRIELRRIGRKIQQRDVIGNGEVSATVVRDTVVSEQPIELASNPNARDRVIGD